MKRAGWLSALVLWACVDEGSQASRDALDAGEVTVTGGAPDAMIASGEAGSDDAGSCEVPASEAELLSYLREGRYRSFERESAPYQSAGPHFGLVRTYLDPTLARSLAEGSARHSRCSAAIKELLDPSEKLSGWAVFVKTEETSPDGSHVLWLETTSTSPGVRPAFFGRGLRLCSSCHAAGRDFVRIDYPLR